MAKLYTLEVTITEAYVLSEEFARANPVLSRLIEIRSDQTLNQLHYAIFHAFGRWDDCHLSEFQFGSQPHDRHARRYVLPFIFDDPEEWDDPAAAGATTRTYMSQLKLEVGSVFWYLYDFGDSWYHDITVAGIGQPEPGAKYPRVIAAVGESPPQYRPVDEGYDDEDQDYQLLSLPPTDWH